MTNKNPYLTGEKLYGDDFDLKKIQIWYNQEAEGYAGLGNNKKETYQYIYHPLNKKHGFSFLNKKQKLDKVLGIGAAWGEEFIPIITQINELYILDSSQTMRSESLDGKKIKYITPEISGDINFAPKTFDLITCFGTLHHIPNVSHVVSEIYKVLKPGAYFMVREPIISMGDWSTDRNGLTKNERGIPDAYFKQILNNTGFKTINEAYCFAANSFLQRKFGRCFKKPLMAYPFYVQIDAFLGKLLKWNLKYHPTKPLERLAPQNIFYVLQKPE